MSQMFAKAIPPAPAVQPPAAMPDPESPQALEAKRRQQLDIMGRAGRSSTILTAPDNRGNSGTAYTGSKLGAGA